MDYICQHCAANLDGGDVFEHFLAIHGDREKALVIAKTMYGWSETDKIHFNKSIIVQPDREPQYDVCPECKGKDPFNLIAASATGLATAAAAE
jgi:hypothetical protein